MARPFRAFKRDAHGSQSVALGWYIAAPSGLIGENHESDAGPVRGATLDFHVALGIRPEDLQLTAMLGHFFNRGTDLGIVDVPYQIHEKDL